MSRFTGPLRIELSDTKQRWARLLEPLVWENDFEGSGEMVIVEAGFESDGVTVPRLLWWIYPPWGHPITRAAILHDWLIHLDIYPREYTDKQFWLAVQAVGVKPVVAWVIWKLVRVFGRPDDKSAGTGASKR